MPIKGLTDRGTAFPEIGQIRKGGAKTDPRKPGPDLKYFRVEFDTGGTGADGKPKIDPRAEKFTKVYGTQPVDINIIFPFNEVEKNWEAWYEAYTAGRMVARSDGEYFTYLVDVQTGGILVINGLDADGNKMPHREIVGRYNKQNGQGVELIKMKPVGRMKVVIPELQSLAYLTVHTTSVYDILNISSQIEAVRQINGGRIAGIPLVLRRRARMISTPDLNDKSKRVRREKYLISIEADPEWVKKMLVQMKHLALPGNGLALLPEGEEHEEQYTNLPAGSENDDDEQPGEFENCEGDQNGPAAPTQPAAEQHAPDPVEIVTGDAGTPTEATDAPSAYDLACDATDKNGKRYGDKSTSDLHATIFGIDKVLRVGTVEGKPITDEQRAQYNAKRQAAQTIIDQRDEVSKTQEVE
jgi:hypothetical protein